MKGFFNNVSPFILILFFTALLLILILFVILLFYMNKVTMLEEKYKKFMRNKEGLGSIEDVIFSCVEDVDFIKQEYNMANNRMTSIENRMGACIQKAKIKRYNVFEDVGSDQSFSVALLDNENNGVIFTGLYTREGTTTYAKPVNNGICPYVLSSEEVEILEETIKNERNEKRSE